MVNCSLYRMRFRQGKIERHGGEELSLSFEKEGSSHPRSWLLVVTRQVPVASIRPWCRIPSVRRTTKIEPWGLAGKIADLPTPRGTCNGPGVLARNRVNITPGQLGLLATEVSERD